ncbi:cytochrome c oxidase assembly protein subunit 17 [Fonticula alba]|uniref:Cytochrome c oxidase assembly protein subunit 17 n=1 Tax=Fonticula alba TaxID=691883 RepID=A0A058Z6F8_FONAL|nr:cytochrome c oxidase assembly protein subunit 17 [Fonticula alba]KCV69112.1 cytochrome c oxidase assembly protein subunit 17 [Fonticula alba]|eukprot:XP_009496683.1 cytochrome c oxidase assembly protein subunit 17 [Fonticula alba]
MTTAAQVPPASVTQAPVAAAPEKKLKPCCACPDTKKVRDLCALENGPDSPLCNDVIEAHKACMRLAGFNV